MRFISWHCFINGSSHPEVFYKKAVLEKFATFTGKQMCWSLFFDKIAGLGNKTLEDFSCEFYETLKNIFFYKAPEAAAPMCMCMCVCVCVCVFISFYRKGFSWLNKITNVMLEYRPAMLCWGNDFVSSTFVATS